MNTFMKNSQMAEYYEVNQIPIVQTVDKNGKTKTKAYYSEDEIADFSDFMVYENGNRICKKQFDDLIKYRDFREKVGQIKVKGELTKKDKERIKELENFMADYEQKQNSGHYTQRLYKESPSLFDRPPHLSN